MNKTHIVFWVDNNECSLSPSIREPGLWSLLTWGGESHELQETLDGSGNVHFRPLEPKTRIQNRILSMARRAAFGSKLGSMRDRVVYSATLRFEGENAVLADVKTNGKGDWDVYVYCKVSGRREYHGLMRSGVMQGESPETDAVIRGFGSLSSIARTVWSAIMAAEVMEE